MEHNQKKRWPERELIQRCWVSMLALLILTALFIFIEHPLGRYGFLLVVMAAALVAFWEFLHFALPHGERGYRHLALGCAALYLLVLSFYSGSSWQLEIWLSAFASFFILFLGSFRLKKEITLQMTVTFFGFFYVVIGLSTVLFIVFGNETVIVGRWWLVYLIGVTKLTDIGAFFIGKRYGKRKLAPRISPNKTVEGLIGGVLLALVGSLLFYLGARAFPSTIVLPLSFGQAIVWGILLACFGHLGDLAESLLKRDAKVKDSNKLPGLGGILDMVDSVLFAGPMLSGLLFWTTF